MFLGDFDEVKAGHSRYYFEVREIVLDFRGDLRIHPGSHWSWQAMVLTASHVHDGDLGAMTLKSVVVDKAAWITSRAILYSCHIGEGAIVAVGAVVRSMDVEPYTMVAGNPAVVVARFDHETHKWVKVSENNINIAELMLGA